MSIQDPETRYEVAVIGGGPAGLVALKTLKENGLHAVLFEAEDDIGGTFKYRAYENAELVSSKQLTAFSDFRFPLAQSDHVSLPRYVAYLQSYAKHFDLSSRIRTSTRVIKVNRVEGGHLVRVRTKGENGGWGGDEQSFKVQHLCICTGLHVLPQMPMVPGIQHITSNPAKQVIHSAEYKSRSQLTGKKVLILGTGETGMDLAYESVHAGAQEVVLCSRGGFLSFPKILNNFSLFGMTFDGKLPIDSLITNLCESAYVHPWVAQSHLRWFVSDFVIKRVLWFLTGTQAGCNQWVGELPQERLGRAYVFLNKSHKAMHFLNRPHRQRSSLLSWISEYHDPPADVATEGVVEMAPFPESVGHGGVVSWDWGKCRAKGGSWVKVAKRLERRKVEPDLVIFATGYRQEFGDWLGEEYPRPWDADTRDIVHSDQPDVAFLGFVRPGVGAIPPIAEIQAMWWTLLIQKRMELPTSTPHYYLLSKESARIHYGVDHSTYMSTVAKDMGAAPGLLHLWWKHGWFILLVYCFSAAFTTNYRLVGPFASPLAPEIVGVEIWDTITRRGLLGNLFMGVIPMVFYAWINLTALVLEFVWKCAGRPDVVGWVRWARGKKSSSAGGTRVRSKSVLQSGQRGRIKADPVAKTG